MAKRMNVNMVLPEKRKKKKKKTRTCVTTNVLSLLTSQPHTPRRHGWRRYVFVESLCGYELLTNDYNEMFRLNDLIKREDIRAT